MKLSDLLALSFENLHRRRGRTALTVIGVVVGTCSIVVMVSLGIAMNQGFDEMLQQWGDLTLIDIYNWGGGNVNGESVGPLTDAVVQEFGNLDNVVVATPVYRSRYYQAQLVSGKKDRYQVQGMELQGVYPQALDKLEYNLISGSYLPEVAPSLSGNSGKKRVQVLAGQYLGYAFMDTKKKGEKAHRYQGQTDAAGNEIAPFVDTSKDSIILTTGLGQETIKSTPYVLDIVGVMKEDYKKGYVTSQGILMDLNVLKQIEHEYIKANGIKVEKGAVGYDNVVVKVDDVKNVDAVEKIIKDQGYQTHSMSSEREEMQKQSQMIQLILGGLGAVSLFVAALSIANTMTMAIYERTREIGVMKVLGCKLPKIRQMFLIEAGMIGFLGGAIGVVVSYLLSGTLNYFGPRFAGAINFLPMFGSKISVIPVWLALLGVVFSTLIGLLSGIMPANRAVQISALEAIRHE